MDFGLSDEHRAIVSTVRDFVRRELVPHEDLVERLDEVPAELAAPFAFPGSRSQAFATPIPRPCRATNICSRSLKTACGVGLPDSC